MTFIAAGCENLLVNFVPSDSLYFIAMKIGVGCFALRFFKVPNTYCLVG